MLIEVKGNHGDFDGGYRRWVERRLRTAFTRVEHHVERIAIRLSEVDDANGLQDRRCVLRVILDHGVETVVQERDDDTRALLERAIQRCRRVVATLMLRSLRTRRAEQRAPLALPLLP